MRRLLPLAAAVCAVHLGPVSSADAKTSYPGSIVAIGDSITRAYNADRVPLRDAPAYSWATGTRGSVRSLYARILTARAAIRGRRVNAARSGARMRDFADQAQRVVLAPAEYVTVLLGANYVCRPSEQAMTPVAAFRAQLEQGMRVLSSGLPDARIQLVSIPDVYRLW